MAIQPIGYLKLWRAMAPKPIWLNSTPEQKTILITLLMMANWKENQWEWEGKKFNAKRGQFVTSSNSIIENCGIGISRQNVRTALKRFKKLEFLTYESTKKGILVTIDNWEVYQGDEGLPNQETNHCLTDAQPTPNQHLTTIEEGKKERREESNNINTSSENNSDIEKLKFNNVDCIEYKLTKYLINYMKQNNEDVRVPSESTKQFDNWCIEFDRIIRIDKKDPEEIKDIIKFCQTDSFWMGNILSVSKLRKQYDQLILKKKNIGKNNYNQTTTERIKSSLENGALKKFLEDDGSNDDERLFCKTNS